MAALLLRIASYWRPRTVRLLRVQQRVVGGVARLPQAALGATVSSLYRAVLCER